MNVSRTKLSQSQMEEVEKEVMKYLKTHPFVTNKILRALTNINYDQAIQFFNSMLNAQKLKKEGVRSGTKYTRVR